MTSKCVRAPGLRLEWGSLVCLGFKQSWSHYALSHHHLLQYTAPMDYLHLCCYLGRSHSAKEKNPAVYPYGDSGIVVVNLTTSYTQRWLLKWGSVRGKMHHIGLPFILGRYCPKHAVPTHHLLQSPQHPLRTSQNINPFYLPVQQQCTARCCC